MKPLNKRYFMILSFILIILGVFLSDDIDLVHASSCDDQLNDLASKCLKYVQWIGSDPRDASTDCCAVVKKIDMKCACDHVTHEVELAIDMKKVVAVAARCGRPIPPGTQCGTYHVHAA